jgi:VanZ family protein
MFACISLCVHYAQLMDYLRPPQPVIAHRRHSASSWLLGAYIAILIYASLFPLIGWRATDTGLLNFLTKPWPSYQSNFDFFSNIFAYIPLGILAAFRWQPKHGNVNALRFSLLLGFTLSLSMESLQNFLPSRVPSWVDLLTNSMGAFIGALIATPYAERLNASMQWLTLRGRWFNDEAQPALLLLLTWSAIQVLPQSSLFLVGELPGLISEDWLGLSGIGFLNSFVDLQTSIVIESLGIVLTLWIITTLLLEVLSESAPKLPFGVAIICVALVGKSIMSIRLSNGDPMYWLTVGAQSGLLVGAISASIAASVSRLTRRRIAVGALIGMIALANLAPISGYQALVLASWTDGPWRSIAGALRHLSSLWPWIALVLLLVLNRRSRRAN